MTSPANITHDPGSVATALAAVAQLGITLEVHDDKLRYRPRDRMTPTLANRLKAHKADVLDILRADSRTNLYRPVAVLIQQARHCGKDSLAVAIRDSWHERLAICVTDGGIPLEDAEKVALTEIQLLYYE